jgi:alkanesulfonate monooxygenase SsuD/methylene tetrahydromethanopterin reductase-like flavin-dependent oxidoreductase (luciferase family)
MVREGRWADMPQAIDDDLLRALSVRGTPAEVAAELRRRYDDIADRVGFYLPYGHDPELVTEIIDAVKSA